MYNDRYTNRGGKGGGNWSQTSQPKRSAPNPGEPKKLPADAIDQAETIMEKLSKEKDRITTSKLRNILSMISDIYNMEIRRTEKELLPENVNRLQMVRVRISYECGREGSVRTFAEEAKLLSYIKGIGKSREEFIRFARYMEALVAYHRFFGGKD